MEISLFLRFHTPPLSDLLWPKYVFSVYFMVSLKRCKSISQQEAHW
ncbi:hypothetical protein HMPREF0080_01687 [Anaeroglobus geminatus F0357]|uniref:Uncharacterized protein n=1 Tax=Anaeroglobus geminatus F0357 TaxID=861450 RepID=G9YJ43_9FIRM|nr:hypothetical protein HMPREF0080_01687 [Anaeroglobus geminatus F0357]